MRPTTIAIFFAALAAFSWLLKLYLMRLPVNLPNVDGSVDGRFFAFSQDDVVLPFTPHDTLIMVAAAVPALYATVVLLTVAWRTYWGVGLAIPEPLEVSALRADAIWNAVTTSTTPVPAGARAVEMQYATALEASVVTGGAVAVAVLAVFLGQMVTMLLKIVRRRYPRSAWLDAAWAPVAARCYNRTRVVQFLLATVFVAGTSSVIWLARSGRWLVFDGKSRPKTVLQVKVEQFVDKMYAAGM